MTNGEKFRTPEDRTREYKKYCASQNGCNKCQLEKFSSLRCLFEWLNLEYKEELKPCPFCGHYDIRIIKNSTGDVWYVSCFTCGCSTGGDVVKDMAIAAWNRRAQ